MPMSKKTKVTVVAASVLLAPLAAKTMYETAKAAVYVSRCFAYGFHAGQEFGDNPLVKPMCNLHAHNLYHEMYDK